jgi:hypothetical protein
VVRTGHGQGRVQWMGKCKGTGRGRKTVKEKVWLNKHQGEVISHVPLLSSCSTKGIRQTRTPRANLSGYI